MQVANIHCFNMLSVLELIRMTLSRTKHHFGHFITIIRVCLTQYNRLG